MRNKACLDYSLYLVTDRILLKDRDFYSSLEEALTGGVTIVQLREKELSSREFYNMAVAVKELTEHYHVPLIINDRLDIALAVDAAGVHLGQSDLTAKVARGLLGKGKILGVSAATKGEAVRAQEEGADYLGVGALFPTATKSNTRSVSLDELREIKRCVEIPVVAIGGIRADNVRKIKKAGIDGIAVVSAIFGSNGIREAASNLHNIMKNKWRDD